MSENSNQEEEDYMVEDFYLYILMRNDMDSLSGGKSVAQGAHAANMFTKYMEKHNSQYHKEYKKWLGGRGYGTTITLSADEEEINQVMSLAVEDSYPADTVIDETYPLKDGKVTHYFPCMTCAYIFAPRRDELVIHLKLMK